MTIAIPSSDAIWISGSLYCKNSESLRVTLETLKDIGYDIEDSRIDSYSIRQGETTPEQMEKNGWSLWHASLKDVLRGKCNSCHSYINRQGIMMHGHRCEVCNEVTYYDIVEGSVIKFAFKGEDRHWMSPYLRMTVKHWDSNEGWLYLLYEFREGDFSTMDPEQSKVYLSEHSDKWETVKEDGQQLVKLRYHLHHWNDPINPETVIEMSDIYGHRRNFSDVKLWDGKEYSQYDHNFPLPEHISIYESWHWAPLGPSPVLHERLFSVVRQVSAADYYYQDGRPALTGHHYKEMGKFIRHFTTLDADLWDRVSMRFRLDGPGGITDVAKFCHPEAVVRNEPNVGNFLTAVGDIVEGRTPNPGTLAAARRALAEDPDTQEFTSSLLGKLTRRKKQ